MPTATIGTPAMRRLRAAATTSSPYDATQSTFASVSGVRQGAASSGNATICSPIAAKKSQRRAELDLCEVAEPTAESEPQRDRDENGERERHGPAYATCRSSRTTSPRSSGATSPTSSRCASSAATTLGSNWTPA